MSKTFPKKKSRKTHKKQKKIRFACLMYKNMILLRPIINTGGQI